MIPAEKDKGWQHTSSTRKGARCLSGGRLGFTHLSMTHHQSVNTEGRRPGEFGSWQGTLEPLDGRRFEIIFTGL
jgi:hypothetical protein